MMSKKEQAELKAAKSDVRRLKRELRAAKNVIRDLSDAAQQATAVILDQAEEIERQRGVLAEKGVVALPDGALKAMESRVNEIAAAPNRTRMMEEFRG
jgi:uncharacterized protein (DUF2345 family)